MKDDRKITVVILKNRDMSHAGIRISRYSYINTRCGIHRHIRQTESIDEDGKIEDVSCRTCIKSYYNTRIEE